MTLKNMPIPGLESSPGGRHGNPLQHSYLENPMDRGAWWVMVHGVAELDTSEACIHVCTHKSVPLYVVIFMIGTSLVAQRVKHLPSSSKCRRPGFDPWVGKIPWRRKWQPTPVFLSGKPHGWRSLVAYSPWSHKESDITDFTLNLW